MANPAPWPLPLSPLLQFHPAVGDQRQATSHLEAAALARVQGCLASLPAVLLVRLALWPATIPDLARGAGRTPAALYNTLAFASNRPNQPSRRLLAGALGLSIDALDYAIVTPPRPLPPGVPGPDVRDGTGLLEEFARDRVYTNLAAFPAGLVLQLVIWPRTEVELAEAIGAEDRHLYQALSALRGPFRRVREGMATFLGVDPAAVDHLLDAEPAEAVRLGTRT